MPDLLALLGRALSGPSAPPPIPALAAPATPPPPPPSYEPAVAQGTLQAGIAAPSGEGPKLADQRYIDLHRENVMALGALVGGTRTPLERRRLNEVAATTLLRLGRPPSQEELENAAVEFFEKVNGDPAPRPARARRQSQPKPTTILPANVRRVPPETSAAPRRKQMASSRT
jgi:hypothetical protein